MRAVIRVGASRTTGAGHLIRCRTLAGELQRQDTQVAFVCGRHPGNRIVDLCEEWLVVQEIPVPDQQRFQKDGDYAVWLGVSEFQAELMAYLLKDNVDD